MHKLSKALTFIGALLALTFCAVSCKTDDDDEPTMYTVTVSDSLEHGKVTADKSSAEAGSKVKLTPAADSGYELDSYSVKDEKSNTIPVTEGTFTMPKSNVTVSATFKETAETVNKNAANAVIAKITAIGTVAYTSESKAKIDEARTAYDGLTEAQKKLVPEETLSVLTAAESKYSELKAATEQQSADPETATYTVKHLQQNIADNNYTLKESETKTGTVGQPTAASAKSYEGFTAQGFTQATIAASGTEVEIKYDRNTYTVTFDSNDGSDVSSQSLRYGATATKPDDPTKTATASTEYTFAGWYTDSGLESAFNFETAITENITLYAKWTEAARIAVFRASTAEVVAGDITVSSDGGNTLKFVPAENWDAELYTGYTALGVCVNTSYMINLVNENMSWNTATSTYPNDNWRMPTNAELKAIYNVKGTLNTSLATISGAEQLIDSYYLSSETLNDEFACVVEFGDGSVKYYYKTDSKLVRVVRDLEVTPTTYIGTKAPTEAKAVGDIVFTDGSATAYTSELTLTDEQKSKAVAVIFYVGTDCSNDSTSRTLGVGLAQNQSGLEWCLSSAKAYNVKITTIQESDKNGSDNLEQIEAFEGVDDTATEANYPAFYFAKNYSSTATNLGETYADGWYLPAKAELQKIYDILSTVNNALDACGGTTFETTGAYWSSSQNASYDNVAYRLSFANGDWNYSLKNLSNFTSGRTTAPLIVCAVRAF